MEIHFAPLQGFTDYLYRRYHSLIYGGIDVYYTPFLRVEKGVVRNRDLRNLLSSREDGYSLIPQIIFNSVEEFDALVGTVKGLGYDRIDLNLGCPYPMQTRRGRGAGMVMRPDDFKCIADRINADDIVSYSVKMRLGIDSNTQWRDLLPLLNETRLSHVTVHPRIAAQMYGGDVDMAMFEEILEDSVHPIIYNGDIATLDDIANLEPRYPNLQGVMIGRGLLSRPSLGAEHKSGCEWSMPARLEKIKQLHDALFEGFSTTLCGDKQVLSHIIPYWDYMGDGIDRKLLKKLRKASTISKYLDIFKNISLGE